MAILQARVADVKKMADQHVLGYRVLVMRRWPQGFARSNVNVWLPDAGPSLWLLKAYREGLVDWQQFEELYRDEQVRTATCRVVRYADAFLESDKLVSLSPLQVLSDLEQQHGTVTVMCWEDSCKCHRHILVDMAKVRV